MSTPEERFTAAWHRDAPRVLAYARRHVGPRDAPGAVAETFTVAWRRWDDVPDPLLGATAAIPADPWHREHTLRRPASLSEDREALLLTAWDGLSSDDAAAALGVSAPSFRKRLHRARHQLGAADGADVYHLTAALAPSTKDPRPASSPTRRRR